MYRWQFNFTPEGTKTRSDLPVAVTAAQTITEVGYWRRLTLLPYRIMHIPTPNTIVLMVDALLNVEFLLVREHQIG